MISKVSKKIFNHVKCFYRKSLFYICFKNFRIVENSFPIDSKLTKINIKKKVKSISTLDFTILHTTIPHNLRIKVLSEVINSVFKSKARSRIGFSKSSIYWTSKGCGRTYFTRETLIDTDCDSDYKMLFYHRKPSVQTRDWYSPMIIDPAPCWAKLFLYCFESKYVQQLISEGPSRGYKFHGTSRLIDDLCKINYDAEFSSSYKYI